MTRTVSPSVACAMLETGELFDSNRAPQTSESSSSRRGAPKLRSVSTTAFAWMTFVRFSLRNEPVAPATMCIGVGQGIAVAVERVWSRPECRRACCAVIRLRTGECLAEFLRLAGEDDMPGRHVVHGPGDAQFPGFDHLLHNRAVRRQQLRGELGVLFRHRLDEVLVP